MRLAPKPPPSMPEDRLFRLLQAATVRVGPLGQHGSGCFVAPGLVLTCWHVVEKLGEIVPVQPWTEQSLGPRLSARGIRHFERPDDLALLALDESYDHPLIWLGAGYQLRDPMASWTYGAKAPAGDSATLDCEGESYLQDRSYLKLKAGQVSPGMSGAPILNQRSGCVCGLLRYTRDERSDLGGLGIPTERIFELLPELQAAQAAWHQAQPAWPQAAARLGAAVHSPQYLTAPGAVPPSGFLGREDELQELRQRLTRGEGRTLALVNAEGGMGKTTLAARYWQQYGQDYRYLAWLFCEEGILSAMRSQLPQALGITEALKPYADDGEQQARLLRDHLNGLPPDGLLVLDNANHPDHIRGFLQVMGGLRWHVLITSRCAKVMPDPESEMPINHLPLPLARELFLRHYREEGPAFAGLLERFLRAVGYNTLCIEIYSKNLREGAGWGLDFAGLLAKLEQNRLTLGEDSFEIATDYTLNVQKVEVRSSDDLIAALYDVAGLDERQPALRDLLLQLALLPPENHSPQILQALLSADSPQALKRQLEQLLRLGWLGSDGKGHRLSPVVQKIMLERYPERKWEVGEPMVGKLGEIFAQESYLHLKNLAGAIPFAEIAREMLGYLTVEDSKVGRLYDGLWTYYQSIGNLATAIACAQHEERVAQAIDDPYLLSVSYERLGTSFLSLGKVEQALAFFQKCNQLSEELCQANPQSESLKNGLAVSYSKLGDLFQAQGKVAQALEFFQKDLKLSEELCQANPQSESLKRGLAISYERLGDLFQAQGKVEQALEFFQQCNQLSEELCQANPQSESLKNGLAVSYSKLGDLFQAQGKVEQALAFFQQYNQLSEELCQANPHSESLKNGLAISHQNLGNLFQAQGKVAQALEFFQQYNQLSEELCQANPRSESLKNGLAISYERLGDLFQAQGKVEQALAFFQKETKLFEELCQANPQSESLKRGLAISHQNLGNIHREKGEFEEAQKHYLRFSDLMEELLEANPHSESLKNGLAISYEKLGDLFQAQGKVAQALEFFQKDLKLSEELYQANPQSESLKNGLAVSYSKLGDLFQAQGKVAQALEFFQKDLKLSEELCQANPHSESLKRGLAISYEKLGTILQAQGKVEQALAFFQQSNQLSEALCQANPQSESLKRGLAVSYSKLGTIFQAQGKVEQALEFFQQYNQLSEKLCQANPELESLKRGLAVSYSKLGEIFQAQGKVAQALEFFQKDLKLSEELCQANPHSESLKRGLAVSYSKLGEIFQAQGKVAQALAFFQQYNQLKEELCQANPHSYELINGRAISYAKLGELHRDMGQPAEARAWFEQAREIWQALSAEVNIPELARHLAQVEEYLAELK